MNKYKVGQGVYWLYNRKNETAVYPEVLVINRVSIDNLGYHYSLTTPHEDIIDWCREEEVFMSREDAERAATMKKYWGLE